MIKTIRLAFVWLLGFCAIAMAQGTSVPFGGGSHDSSLPVEITADLLELDETTGTAVFSGSVRVGQDALRIAADQLKVYYAESDGDQSGAIEKMEASGNVTLSNGVEAAESDLAKFNVTSSVIEMEGNVLLTQGKNALSSNILRIDLNTGSGTLEGRVRTIFQPGETQ